MITKDLAKLEDIMEEFTAGISSDYDTLICSELSRSMARAAATVFDAHITAQLYWQKENA
jgi:hypothetical protein